MVVIRFFERHWKRSILFTLGLGFRHRSFPHTNTVLSRTLYRTAHLRFILRFHVRSPESEAGCWSEKEVQESIEG